MPTTITVQSINLPKIGKKQGSIVDTQNRRWQVWGTEIGKYQVGGSYDVLKAKESTFNGQTYVLIEDMIPASGVVVQHPSAAHQPAMAQPAAQHSDAHREMHIFVCGALNNILANQNVNPLALEGKDFVMMVNRLKEAWRRTLGPNAAQNPPAATQRSQELDDEIPF